MGHIRYRFTLTHTSGSKVISEPEGWREIKLILERDNEYFGVTELFEVPVILYGTSGEFDGGYDFFNNIDTTFGPDAQIYMLVEVNPNESGWEDLCYGVLDVQAKKKIDLRKIRVPFIINDFWAKFKNRSGTPVNILSATDLYDESVNVLEHIQITLPSQIINKTTIYYGHTGEEDTLIECSLATTANITLSGLQTIDGSMTTQGMRILVKNQTDQTQNGTYNSSSGSWTRTVDGNTGAELEQAIVQVLAGAVNEDTVWKQQTDPITLGTSNIVWASYDYVSDYLLYDDPSSSITGTAFWTQGQSDRSEQKEIDNSFTLPFIGTNPFAGIVDVIEVVDDSGQMEITWDIDMQLQMFAIPDGGDPVSSAEWEVSLFAKQNSETPILIDVFTFSEPIDPFSGFFPKMNFDLFGSTTIDILPGDLIYSYIEYTISFIGVGFMTTVRVYGGILDSSVTFKVLSTYPESKAEGFLIHDVAAQITDRITGVANSFYSEYLGSQTTKARQYASNGCGFPFILNRGLQLRLYSLEEKPFSISFKQWWDGANPIINLGLMYDTIDGNNVIRVEDKAFFFDDDPILYLDFVNKIEEDYDKDNIFKNLKIGYTKWQSEDISGIDDPQTNHDYALPFKTAGIEKVLQSTYIAASLAIERMRRTTRIKSSDDPYDNETFIIALNRDEIELGNAIPELYENFNLVTNLLNAETRYNLALTPLRNLIRWGNFFNGCLQKTPEAAYKFTFGEGNFDMVSDYSGAAEGICFNIIADSLSEKQNIALAGLTGSAYGSIIGYLFQPIIFTFTHPLTFAQYKLIRENRTKAIAISVTDENYDICFIKRLEYDINKSKATFTLWKK